MTLKLVMIRCPDNVAPERREVRGGEFSIGRGRTTNGSSPILTVICRRSTASSSTASANGKLHDLSTNGTFLNQASDPIGKGASQKLRNGDRVKFGLYEIEVIIDEEESARERDNFLAPSIDPLPSRSEVRPLPGCPAAQLGVDAELAQFADPAGGLRSARAQSGAVRGTDGLGSRASPSKRLPAARAGRDHSRRLGRRLAVPPPCGLSRRGRSRLSCRRKTLLPHRQRASGGRQRRRQRRRPRRRATLPWSRPSCVAWRSATQR